MYRYINLFFVVFTLCLFAVEDMYIEPKVAIKMIDKSDVQFISAQKSITLIKNSKIIDMQRFSSSNILGNNSCEPFYDCFSDLKKYFLDKNINKNQLLIFYDNSYGIYAATLYSMLESLGYKKMLILNGGLRAILKIDPNQKLYDKYKIELDEFLKLISKDDNRTLEQEYESKIINLRKKLLILKPYLLSNSNNIKSLDNSIYSRDKINRDYFLSKIELENTVNKIRQNYELNATVIDICPMVDTVGNEKGSYLAGVTVFSWKELIDKNKYRLKSKEELDILFKKYKLNKSNSNYIYCMSGSPKALYMMTVMRYLGYEKVKAFTGDWNVWVGDIND